MSLNITCRVKPMVLYNQGSISNRRIVQFLYVVILCSSDKHSLSILFSSRTCHSPKTSLVTLLNLFVTSETRLPVLKHLTLVMCSVLTYPLVGPSETEGGNLFFSKCSINGSSYGSASFL